MADGRWLHGSRPKYRINALSIISRVTPGEMNRQQINLPLNSHIKRNALTALPRCRSDVQLVLGFSVCMAVFRQRDTFINTYQVLDGGARTRFE